MTNPDYPNTWLTLDDIRKKLPSSNWRHGSLYEYATVASEKKMLLSDFLSLEEEDMAYEIAYRRAKGTIEAYENLLSERRSKSQQR